MNKKRHFLEAPEVKDYLVKGERFTKWSEVSTYFKSIFRNYAALTVISFSFVTLIS